VDDVPVLVGAYSDPAIQQWHGRSMDDAEALEWIDDRRRGWRDEEGGDWAVVLGGDVVARASLHKIDLSEGFAEIGYWVLPGHRGAGIGTRAVGLLTDWAFGQLGLHRIELLHSTRNPASCGLATRAGYRLEGTLRQHTPHQDGWHDMHLHARVAGDPPAARVSEKT
jgi:RimJ/RimL family protein N-acetyltransferase